MKKKLFAFSVLLLFFVSLAMVRNDTRFPSSNDQRQTIPLRFNQTCGTSPILPPIEALLPKQPLMIQWLINYFSPITSLISFPSIPIVNANPTPVTVGTSTSTGPVEYGFQKKCFYANGRWWVFYYGGSNFGWRTSTDGTTWSAFNTYGAYSSDRFDIWYDEVNNKICLVHTFSSDKAYYRQGTANSDGSITWDSAEVGIADTDASNGQYNARVCKDSNGYPWVSYRTYTGSKSKVVKATTTTGSAWGTPTTLWTATSSQTVIVILPLTGGKMLAINCPQVSPAFQSRLFDGSTWQTAVSVCSSAPASYQYWDAVADGDNVHFVMCKATSFDIIYVKYTYGTGWGSEETVESATVAQCHPTITWKDTDKVRVFYLLSQTEIRYRDRDTGSWQTAVTISDIESTMTCVCSSYKAYSSKFCVTWKSGASSPYNVQFESYTLGAGFSWTVDLTETITTAWNILTKWNAIADFSQPISSAWNVLIQSTFNTISSLSIATSLVIAIISTFSIGLSQVITTSWSVLTQWNAIASLSQPLSTVWNVLTQWTSNVGLTQSLSTAWTIITQTSYNIIASLSNTFTWTVDVLKYVGQHYTVDLSLTIVTSWIVNTIHTWIDWSMVAIGLAMVAFIIAAAAIALR